MARPVKWLGTAVAALIVGACVTGSRAVSVFGRHVAVSPARDARATPLTGELIAVSAESLWVLGDTGLGALPLGAVDRVSVRRHNFTAGRALAWALVGAAVTGGALSAACSSVEGAECGRVFPGVALSWVFWGGLAAASADASSKLRIDAARWDSLRAYARFPQGIPAGVDRRALRAAAAVPTGQTRP